MNQISENVEEIPPSLKMFDEFSLSSFQDQLFKLSDMNILELKRVWDYNLKNNFYTIIHYK